MALSGWSMAAAPLAGDLRAAAAPPAGPISSGRQVSMEELNQALANFSKKYYDAFRINDLSHQARELAYKRWR